MIKQLEKRQEKQPEKRPKKQPRHIRKIDREIIKLIKSNENISRKDLAVVLHKSEGSIKYHLKKLQEKEVINRIGPDKGGYWEITDKRKIKA